jgi:hypothetical protein
MNKQIKKGNLNFDQSGRAYPDNPQIKENWDCIWENDGRYYELIGDTEHKEWEQVKVEVRELSDKEETYSIPIYENGIKTEWSVDGIVGDEKYKQLTEMSPEGKLPIIINTKR